MSVTSWCSGACFKRAGVQWRCSCSGNISGCFDESQSSIICSLWRPDWCVTNAALQKTDCRCVLNVKLHTRNSLRRSSAYRKTVIRLCLNKQSGIKFKKKKKRGFDAFSVENTTLFVNLFFTLLVSFRQVFHRHK